MLFVLSNSSILLFNSVKNFSCLIAAGEENVLYLSVQLRQVKLLLPLGALLLQRFPAAIRLFFNIKSMVASGVLKTLAIFLSLSYILMGNYKIWLSLGCNRNYFYYSLGALNINKCIEASLFKDLTFISI